MNVENDKSNYQFLKAEYDICWECPTNKVQSQITLPKVYTNTVITDEGFLESTTN